MGSMIPILLAVTALVGGAFLVMLFMGRTKKTGGIKGNKDKILREAAKKLAQDPKNPEALSSVGDVYFKEEIWDQAYKTYGVLMDMEHNGPNQFDIAFRFGMSAMKLGLVDDAYRGFAAAKALQNNNFEVNFNLGTIEFARKNYEKTITLLNQAKSLEPDHAPTLRTLGHAFFKMKKNKEAMTYIRKAIDLAPNDKESLFTLAECYFEANQTDQAQRIYSHLRGDPVMGASACLSSGMIHEHARHYDKAAADFEIGLRHENIKPDVKVELRYHLATSCIKLNDIGKALSYLREISLENPSYKDVAALIGRYQELNANKNLQIYLMAPSGDFVALGRKIVMSYYPRSTVKVLNISVNKNEWADILADVNTPKWSDVIMFRFIRSQGSVGELIVRDFHSHLKEVKAGKGICVSVGVFTDEAKRYTEARLIDLIEKDRLQAILNTVDAKVAQASTGAKKK